MRILMSLVWLPHTMLSRNSNITCIYRKPVPNFHSLHFHSLHFHSLHFHSLQITHFQFQPWSEWYLKFSYSFYSLICAMNSSLVTLSSPSLSASLKVVTLSIRSEQSFIPSTLRNSCQERLPSPLTSIKSKRPDQSPFP